MKMFLTVNLHYNDNRETIRYENLRKLYIEYNLNHILKSTKGFDENYILNHTHNNTRGHNLVLFEFDKFKKEF